jgi:hypothetical protein
MPELAIRRTFAEIYMCDEIRSYEMRSTSSVGRQRRESRGFRLPLSQFLKKRTRFGLREAGTDLAGKV